MTENFAGDPRRIFCFGCGMMLSFDNTFEIVEYETDMQLPPPPLDNSFSFLNMSALILDHANILLATYNKE